MRGLPQQAIDMLDDIRDLINSGKYQGSVATSGIPGWSANTGEFAFFSAGSDRRVYLRSSTAWQLVAGFDPTLLPSALGTANAGTGNVFSLVDHIHTAQTIPTPFVPEAGFNNMQAFTSNGTWNLGTGTTYVFVELWGAGGGGAGGGGSNTGMTSGGTSKFAGLSAVGGQSGGNVVEGAGGTAAGGVINITGQAGAGGWNVFGLAGGVTSVEVSSGGGAGGMSPRGGGGGVAQGRGAGNSGVPPGGGGGGGGATLINSPAGGGGGAGGYCSGLVTVVGSATVAVQVGAAGVGGTGAQTIGGAGGQGLVMVYWAST